MTGRIGIIGANAYLAENISAVLKDVSLFARMDDWMDLDDCDAFDWIINFSIQPDFRTKILPHNELIDVNVSNAIKDII